MTLNPSTAQTINVDGKVSFTAAVQPDNATDKTVKWSVVGTNSDAVKLYSDADCKTEVGTGATDTLTVYAKGMSAGTATVTATATNGTDDTADDKSASCAVTVNAVGYTVTYIDSTGTNEKREFGPYSADYEYKIEGGRIFPKVPQGKKFDGWKDSNGTPYTENTIIKLNSSLTLYAQWKDASQDSGTQPQRRGGGLSGDLVFFGGSGADDGWEYIGGGYAPQRAYRLSFAPMQDGSAYFLLTSGENGETMNVYPQSSVRVVPTPAPGYRLASIVWSMIDGSASYDITESQTFVMPAMDAVVYVTFQPIA